MAEYTPTTDEIREFVATADAPGPWSPPDAATEAARGAAFDRWLAARDRGVKAEALRGAAEAYSAGQISGLFIGPVDYTKHWLRYRADQIEGGHHAG